VGVLMIAALMTDLDSDAPEGSRRIDDQERGQDPIARIQQDPAPQDEWKGRGTMTEKKKSVCVGCAFASWDKTLGGRRHPHGGGKCLWSVTVPFAESVSTYAMSKDAQASRKLTISGGRIQFWESQFRIGEVTCLVKAMEPAQ
jgi:hypothetical protein